MKISTSLRTLLLLLGIATAPLLKAQQRYWIYLADKGPEQAYWQAHPEAYLSPKALARHMAAGHAQSVSDLPVSATYCAQLARDGVQIHGASRWLNAVSVETSLSLKQLQAICPAVTAKKPVARFTTTAYDQPTPPQRTGIDSMSYGMAQQQIDQLQLQCLHDRGFTGHGVLIAVFDAGFFRMDTISAFDSLWLQNRILTYYDFVNHDSTVFDEHNHGMNVSSILAANLPGQMMGAAPSVTLALARTENVFSETHQEEDNWMQAVEWADSLGADQIHSSLGYTLFDPGEGDFTYADLDGNTTVISRAADMAAARGILVVNSAGNEGTAPWHHISAPCDADSILCVGAVDDQSGYVSFSGVGPSADGRVKPDVAALGLGTAFVDNDGNVGNGAGTSFSSPLISGFAACLHEAHPLRSNMDIIRAVRESASQYNAPDTLLGYGIPNACKADSILDVMDSLALAATGPMAMAQQVLVFPNPATDLLVIQNQNARNPMATIAILAADGRTVLNTTSVSASDAQRTSLNIKSMASGVYFVRIALSDGKMQTTKFIKQ